MEKINCNISANIETSNIKISGIKDGGIEINYSGDVDFTELVNSLILIIDEQKEVEYSIDEIPDNNEKLKLVIETIKDILKNYNDNISLIEDENVNSFGNIEINTSTDNISNTDDYPF